MWRQKVTRPATENEFAEYTEMEDTGGPCPWCGRNWGPDPDGKAHAARTHTTDCPYWLWLIDNDDEDDA
jgi:hypothetical protein